MAMLVMMMSANIVSFNGKPKVCEVSNFYKYEQNNTETTFDISEYEMIGSESQIIKAWDYSVIPYQYTLDLRNMQFPLEKTYVTSNYGYRKRFGRNHYGVDLKAAIGDTVYAAESGMVRISKANSTTGYGTYIVLRHSGCIETVYGHLSKLLVERNEMVMQGQPIALSGNTGRSTGPHLHFEIRFMGITINPQDIFDFNNRKITQNKYEFVKTRS